MAILSAPCTKFLLSFIIYNEGLGLHVWLLSASKNGVLYDIWFNDIAQYRQVR